MRGFFAAQKGDPTPADDSRHFDAWLAEALLASPSERETRLIEWEKAPRARACHPREEHLLPLMVCAGAAAESEVTLPYRTPLIQLHTLGAHFA
jgi:aromatic ring-opening dioxygenase catalytic subunit (LigB family)